MDRRLLPKRRRINSSPLDMNAASKFAAADFGNVAGASGQRSPSDPNLSTNIFTAGLPLEVLPPSVGDSNSRAPARLSAGPILQTYSAEENLSNQSSSEEEIANLISVSSGIAIPNSVLKRYTSPLLASAASVDNVKSSNPSALPQNEDLPDLVLANTATESIDTTGPLGSVQDLDLGYRPLHLFTNEFFSDNQNEQSLSGTADFTTVPSSSLKSAAESLKDATRELSKYYGSKLSIMTSLNKGEHSLTELLQSVYTSLQTFKAHPDAAKVFPMVHEDLLESSIIIVESNLSMIPELVQDYELGRNMASNATTLAAEAIGTCMSLLFTHLRSIYRDLR